MFEFMKTLTLHVRYECQKGGRLPAYLGSTIRGILGHCIHDFYCRQGDKKCFLCAEREECKYVQCFSNTGGEAGAVNPYTIYVYGQGKEKWEKGDCCVFDITLFGSGTEHAGVYLDALIAAEDKGWGAERIPFRLLQVTDRDSGRLIYAGGKSWIRNLIPRPVSVKEREAAYACLVFDTPLRVVSGGELFQKLPFQLVIQFLTRRISLMTEKYTNYNLEWDAEEMMRRAAEIRTVEESWKELSFSRYSVNQPDHKLELASQTGWVLYQGNLSPFVPVLEIGRYLRLGKGATIGFGHYDISYDK